MNSILKHYNENLANESIELEISYNIIKSIEIYKSIFNKLKELSSNISIIENLDIYYTDNIRQIKVFNKGVNQQKDVIMKKESIQSPYIFREQIDNVINHKLKLSLEKKLKSSNTKDIKLLRIKLRVRFDINDKYFIDLDLIKNLDKNEKHIKEIKDMLFKDYNLSNMVENINYSLFDNMLIEVEFKKKELDIKDINTSNDFVKSLLVSNISNYQRYIFNIAKFIIGNKIYLENFKSKSGLKKLLNNVIELSSDSYYKNIIPNITNYYITDKIDGLRCICFIEEYEDGIINIKLVTNKLYNIKEFNKESSTYKKKCTILDCELLFIQEPTEDLISKDTIYLYIFDILTYENNRIGFSPFEERIKILNDGYDKIKNHIKSRVKEYIKLTDKYKEEIKEFYDRKNNDKNYSIDGLIFVPNSNVTNTQSKFPINSNYNNMIGYKWKPAEHMTIDFYVCKLPKNLYTNIPYNKFKLKNNDVIYILFSGISMFDYNKLNMTFMIDYKKIVPEKTQNGSLIPIQFSTSDHPYNYIFITDMEKSLDKKICEFGYNLKSPNETKWEFKKIRTDRDVELERGEYYGNYYKISEMIWNNINNPLTLEMLIKDDNSSYFLKDDNMFYKAQRSYNSFVKSYILETIIDEKLIDKNETNLVIDMAAGKGQDLARLSNLGFKTGIFLDNDKNALSELINRKHNLKTKGNMEIYTKNINLTSDYKDIIKELNIFNLKKESVDIIICNFAIHYIISNENNLINIIKLLTYYLKPNGRFIFTCFDGNKVFNLLKDVNIWNEYEDNKLKYSIKKNYKDNIMSKYGQKIDVLLPFSNNDYYTENLIDIENLIRIFNSNGFTTEISLSFTSLLNNFKENNKKIYDNLTNADKEFINLYQFVIIKKNQANSIISKSNISSFFESSIEGSFDKKEIGNLHLIENINNSNRILILVNTTLKPILTNIIKLYKDNNYKDWNENKKSKNKIVKIIGFDHNNYLNEYFKSDTNKTFDIIIIYDKLFNYDNYLNSYMIKKSITPVILTDNSNNKILILNNETINYLKIEQNTSFGKNNDIYETMDNYIKKNNILYIHN